MKSVLTASTVGGVATVLLLAPAATGQGSRDRRPSAPEEIAADHYDVSLPLRDLALRPSVVGVKRRRLLPVGRVRPAPRVNAETDPVLRAPAGPLASVSGLNFDGQGANGTAPPDTNGAAGPTQYVQWVNVEFSVYDKTTGARIAGPFPGTHFWSGFGGLCETVDGGDPVILYDKEAGRWVATQLAYNVDFTSNSYCVAVSETSDALGSYARYEFNFGNQFPDYPKLGIWPDGYYVTSNTFLSGVFFIGAKACAMDRSRMIAGLSASMICFQLGRGESSLLPSDLDGTTPPPLGSPNYNLSLGTSTNLRLFKFHADFAVPASSTFSAATVIPVAAYTDASSVAQPPPGELLDSLGDRLMHRLAYRNLGDHESILATHSVNGGGGFSAVRWYEIRLVSGSPTVFQQGTLGFSNVHLWMPSIAMDKVGNIALTFNASSSSVQPSLGATGRVPTGPPGVMSTPTAIVRGTGVQIATGGRWGDYAAIVLDPADDCTFWLTGEYMKTTGAFNWSTRIASGKFPTCN